MNRAKTVSLGLWAVVGLVGAVMVNQAISATPTAALPSGAGEEVSANAQSFGSLFEHQAATSSKTETSGMTLVGVLYSDNPEESKALLQTADGKTKVYSLNADTPNGAKLTKINPKFVELVLEDRVEVLNVKKQTN